MVGVVEQVQQRRHRSGRGGADRTQYPASHSTCRKIAVAEHRYQGWNCGLRLRAEPRQHVGHAQSKIRARIAQRLNEMWNSRRTDLAERVCALSGFKNAIAAAAQHL